MRSTIAHCWSVPSAALGMTSVSWVHQWPMPILPYSSNDVFEADFGARGRVKERLPLIGSRPLRAGNVVFTAFLRAVGAAAGVHEAVDEGLLLADGNWFHHVSESAIIACLA